ncbi:MAG: TonB-dependent receptor plug domain-containing protein [Myxococcota bacterium]
MKPTPPHPTYLSERVASFAAVPSRGWSVHRHQRVFPGAGTFGVLLGWSLLHPAVQAQRSLAQTPTEQTASNESAKESAQAQPAANTNPDPNDPGSTDVGASAYQARAVAHPGPIALHGLDPSASGTEVPAATDVAMATTSEVLRQTPGSHVVAVGGMGSGSRLALRGAQFGHTVYMLGDLPLTGPDTGPLDLSLLPLEAFESLEVFRGGAPAWLLSPSIGGVVRLKPRRDYRDYLMLETGWGSFGTHRSSASAVVWSNRTMVVSSVGAYGSQNDYPIHYDNGTVFDPSDDESRRRQNAHVLGGHGLFHSRSELESGGTLEIALLALSRQGGAPGPSAIYARHSRRNETQGIGSASLIQPFGRGHRVGLLWGGGHQRRQFIDRFGEIGLGREISDDRISAMHLRSSLELSVAEYLEITTLLAVRRDRYLPDFSFAASAASAWPR